MGMLENIRAEIQKLITVDLHVSPEDVQVTLKNFSILISGTVDSSIKLESLRRILEPYRKQCLLRDQVILNLLYHRPDEELHSSCRKILQMMELDAGEKIQLHVADGVILLTGIVFARDKKISVDLVCAKLSGVRGYQNLIKVIDPGIDFINHSSNALVI